MAEESLRHQKRILNRSFVLNTHRRNNVRNYSLPTNFNENSDHHQQQRLAYARKKAEVLICSICEGPAHGYNFDAITCESCKAFFRRNALKSGEKLKCRMNDGRCVITVSTRKRCKACRLAKCLEQGMRADWILTDEQRVNKQKKIEENRRLRRILYPDSSDTDDVEMTQIKTEPTECEETFDDDCTASTYSPPVKQLLASDDLLKIQQIQQAYSDSVRLTSLPREIPSYPNSVRISKPSEMINFPTNLQTTRLITFFKLLPEFSSMNEDDKLVQIKYNAFALVFIRAALTYDPVTDTYHEPNTDDCIFAGRDLIQCFSFHQYEQSTKCIRNLRTASLNDPFLLQVLLIIMLFSKGSSICAFGDKTEPLSQDILTMYKNQNLFIDLLWKYCETKFGYAKTIKIWLNLTQLSMEAHLQAHKTIFKYIKSISTTEQLSPLMKSILLLI